MSKQQDQNTGLMSSAGLVRYFDAEESAFLIDPRTVIAIGGFAAFALIALNILF